MIVPHLLTVEEVVVIDLLETMFYLSFLIGFMFGGMELYVLYDENYWRRKR